MCGLCVCKHSDTLSHAHACRHEGRKDDFHAVLGAAMPRVNLAFFSLAGASLRLAALAATLRVALGIAAVRLAAVAVGSYAGCWASGAPASHRRLFWQSMLTQARSCSSCL